MSDIKKILMVEDRPEDQMLIKRSLTKAGVANEVVIANDGVEALELLFGTEAAPAPAYALVLLDLKLPRLDGHQVLEKIRENEKTVKLPVVILTSSDEQDDIVRSYKHGANSYVRKPVNFEDFSKSVRDVGLYWLVTNVSPD